MFDGAYPPGVTAEMIDDLEGINEWRYCKHCSHYINGYCSKELDNEELETVEKRDPDDYCDEFNGSDDGLDPYEFYEKFNEED